MSSLSDYKKSFPKWEPTPLTSVIDLSPSGIDLLGRYIKGHLKGLLGSLESLSCLNPVKELSLIRRVCM